MSPAAARYEPRWDRLDALLALLGQRSDGMTPGAAWRAITANPEHGEVDFRWDAGTLISAGLIERDGALWRIGPAKQPPTALDFGGGPWAPADDEAGPIEAAGELFLRDGLRAGGSVFARGAHIWTVENAGYLADAVAELCRDRPGDFESGLRALIPVCSDDTRVLLAELLALSMLTIGPDDMAPNLKRGRILEVFYEISQYVLMPVPVDKAFETGSTPPGTWYSRQLWPAVQYLAEFAAMWMSQPPDVRDLSVEHEHAWYSLVLGAGGGDAAVQREALLYLGHPGAFVPVFTGTAKRAIAEGLADEIGYREPDEMIDATLARIALVLQAELRTEIDFYAPRWRERWEPYAAPPPVDEARTAWLVYDSYPGSGDYLGEWLHEGIVTVPVEDGAAEWSQIGEGDLIATGTREVMHLGVVTGPSTTHEDDMVRRPVRWLTEQRPIELSFLLEKLTTDFRQPQRVLDLRADHKLLASLARSFT